MALGKKHVFYFAVYKKRTGKQKGWQLEGKEVYCPKVVIEGAGVGLHISCQFAVLA